MKRVEKMAVEYADGVESPHEGDYYLDGCYEHGDLQTAFEAGFRAASALHANLVTDEIALTTELDGIESLISVRAKIEMFGDQPVDEKEGE